MIASIAQSMGAMLRMKATVGPDAVRLCDGGLGEAYSADQAAIVA